MAVATADKTPRSNETTSNDASLDVVYDLLRSHRRRMVLRYLRSESGSSTATELAEHVAAVESGTPEHSTAERECERVLISLTQCHLPKFEDAGAVELDDSGGVELTDAGAEIESHLPENIDSTSATRKATAAIFLGGCGVGAVGAVLVGRLDTAPGAALALLLMIPIAAAVAWPRASTD